LLETYCLFINLKCIDFWWLIIWNIFLYSKQLCLKYIMLYIVLYFEFILHYTVQCTVMYKSTWNSGVQKYTTQTLHTYVCRIKFSRAQLLIVKTHAKKTHSSKISLFTCFIFYSTKDLMISKYQLSIKVLIYLHAFFGNLFQKIATIFSFW
jgi:hypothetical protein